MLEIRPRIQSRDLDPKFEVQLSFTMRASLDLRLINMRTRFVAARLAPAYDVCSHLPLYEYLKLLLRGPWLLATFSSLKSSPHPPAPHRFCPGLARRGSEFFAGLRFAWQFCFHITQKWHKHSKRDSRASVLVQVRVGIYNDVESRWS